MAHSRQRGAEEEEKDPYGHPRIPYRGHYDRERCDLRRRWVERFTSSSLAHVGQWWEGEGQSDACSCLKLKGNIENPIGLVKVPVAVAGPLFVRGKHVSGYVLLPFATTEGALVASATRGAAALTRSGGVRTLALAQRMSRVPSFVTRNSGEAAQLWPWLQSNFDALQKQVRLFSQHTTLVGLTPAFMGRTLLVTFNYTTGDAAGQNMVTTATWNACKWALREVEKDLPSIRVVDFYVATAQSGDKKASPATLYATRGVHVQAEAWIPESVLKSTLKVDVHHMLGCYSSFMEAMNQMGAIGTGVNFGNVLASVFIAAGQDVAALSESAIGHLIIRPATKEEIESQGRSTEGPSSTEQIQQLELMNGDNVESDKSENGKDGLHYAGIYACVVLPSLVVGTVGGGTSLATQKECLAMMGCYGKGHIFRLAEIIAGFVLALDLSTIAAIGSGQFAVAHEKLGRNKPTDGLKPEHLDTTFFQSVVGGRGKVDTWSPVYVHTGNSILSELTKNEMSKKVGHFGFHVKFRGENGKLHTLPVVVKSKPTDVETSNMINKMAQGCGLKLASLYEKHKMDTGFSFCSEREVEIFRLENPTLKCFMPTIYHTMLDSNKNIYIIVMEFFSDENYTLLNTADDISDWTLSDIKVVLRDMAHAHSLFLNQTQWLHSRPWLQRTGGKEMAAMAPLWGALVEHAHSEFPEMWTAERASLIQRAINNIPGIWSALDPAPHTMVHNDFNPRNICIRKVRDHTHQPPSSHMNLEPDSNPQTISSSPYSSHSSSSTSGGPIPYPDPRHVCIYDWELATINVPQRDLVEFLSFTLPSSSPTEKWLELIDFYRQHLEFYSGVAVPVEKFMEVFHASCFHFAMKRLSMYTMAHTYKDYRFLPRVVSSLFSFLTAEFEKEEFRPRLSPVKSKL